MPKPLPDNAISLTRGGLAVVTRSDGTIDGAMADGFYLRDRRVISMLKIEINGSAPRLLASARLGPARHRLVYGVWAEDPDPKAIIERTIELTGSYREDWALQVFRTGIEVDIEVGLDGDSRTVYGLDRPRSASDDVIDLGGSITASGLGWTGTALKGRVVLRPGVTERLSWLLQLTGDPPEFRPTPEITSDDRRLDRAVAGGLWDLDALTVVEPKTGRGFVAAGAPHFLAVFGRDALIVSLLSMLRGTEPALSVLEVLAAHQGAVEDQRTVESPGRILHELRIGGMGVFGLDPGHPYFASVDATPLFVVLLAECLAWGADIDRIRPLLPTARACLDWCRRHVDSHGFVPSIPHTDGIENQGWKDSGDSIVTADGRTLHEQTTLAEVQGYVHNALTGMAELEEHVGDSAHAPLLREEADRFRRRFLQHFEVGAPVHLAPWLDADGSPIAVRASNVGHLLAGGLLDNTLVEQLCDRLLEPAEFSGWGIRTLAATEPAYNPMGYHIGSVWPHDTALAMRGMARRGRRAEAQQVATALLELSEAEDDQLPELLGGFARRDIPTPVPYPSSARPQAWAAAVPLQVAAVRLGIEPELHRNRLRFRPLLDRNEWIEVRGLNLGSRRLDVLARGSEITVTGDLEGLQIEIIDGLSDPKSPLRCD